MISFSELGMRLYYGTDASRYKKHAPTVNMVISGKHAVYETTTVYELRVEETDDINELLAIFDVPYEVACQWLQQHGVRQRIATIVNRTSSQTTIDDTPSAKTETVSCTLANHKPTTACTLRKEMRHVSSPEKPQPDPGEYPLQKFIQRAGVQHTTCPRRYHPIDTHIARYYLGGDTQTIQTPSRDTRPSSQVSTPSPFPSGLAEELQTIRPRVVEARSWVGASP